MIYRVNDGYSVLTSHFWSSVLLLTKLGFFCLCGSSLYHLTRTNSCQKALTWSSRHSAADGKENKGRGKNTHRKTTCGTVQLNPEGGKGCMQRKQKLTQYKYKLTNRTLEGFVSTICSRNKSPFYDKITVKFIRKLCYRL